MRQNKEVELDEDVKIYHRELDYIEDDIPAAVWYRSTEPNNNKPQVKAGTISGSYSTTDKTLVWVEAANQDKLLEITICDSLNQSSVREKESNSWNHIGQPVKLLASDYVETPPGLLKHHKFEQEKGKYESVVAIAAIEMNKEILSAKLSI
jgi:hypothetical protein